MRVLSVLSAFVAAALVPEAAAVNIETAPSTAAASTTAAAGTAGFQFKPNGDGHYQNILTQFPADLNSRKAWISALVQANIHSDFDGGADIHDLKAFF